MKEQYHKWFTEYLDREFHLLEFGHDGYPVVLFPSSKGRYYENKDNGMIESAKQLIEYGKVRIYCPDGIDYDSWYNYSIHPSDRVKTHNGYENTILNDVIEYIRHTTEKEKVGVAGCSLGGYHSVNLAFRHPDIVESIICMGGSFDIKPFVYGYYDENCYFNNPPDYMPNLTDDWYLSKIKQMKIILGTGEKDFCKDENINFSNILNSKGIDHLLEIRTGVGHDWNWWRNMFPEYLDKIIN